MTTDKMRSHPSIILGNSWLFIFIFMFVTIASSIIMGIVLSIIVVIVFTILWRISTMEITPQGIIVCKNFITKTKKTIPYDKIASVNTPRNIINRIFGTTTISVNINSSVNAALPEANFSFKMDVAEKVKSEIEKRILNDDETPEEIENIEDIESVISFSFKEIALHSLFGASSFQLIYTIALLGYSVFSMLFLGGQGIWFALLMLVVGEVIPSVMQILKYNNFKIYRKNNTIYVQHGALSLYKSSFEIKRINSIKIKETYFARVLKRASIEAEVVGLGSSVDEVKPLLCLLAKKDKIPQIIESLVPEFMEEYRYIKQPKSAKTVMSIQGIIVSLIVVVVMSYPCFYAYSVSPDHFSGVTLILAQYGMIFLTALIVALIFVRIPYAMEKYEYSLGSNLFSIINGVVDRSTSYVQYDRVQIADIAGSSIVKRFGLSRLTVKMLSSVGQGAVQTGFFEIDDLEKVGEIVMKRLSDGTYDYRKSSL